LPATAFAGLKKSDKESTMLERIKASLPSLAPAEQRVGKLVLADPRAFAKLPVTELADRAHVSK
jgi:RpiR family carbohydrate utilization transcriptional regulator